MDTTNMNALKNDTLKSKREFLSPVGVADSYYSLEVHNHSGHISLYLSDCYHRIELGFSARDKKTSKKKIAKLKGAVDAIYYHFHPEDKP